MTALAKFLEIAFPGKLAFLKEGWIQGVPIRHVFMIAAVQALAERSPSRRPLSILEIGTWMGSSCLTWADALQRYNGGEGSIIGIDPLRPYFSPDHMISHLTHTDTAVIDSQAGLAREMAGLLENDFVYDVLMHNVKTIAPPTTFSLIRKPSKGALPELEGRQFDLIYIDGAHFYEEVRFDVDWACRLVAPGGIVCGDDLELQLHEVDEEFARAHGGVDFPTDPKTKLQYHPGVALAVGERFGPVRNYEGFWAVWKKADGAFETVTLEDSPIIVPMHFPASARASVLSELKKWKAKANPCQKP